MLKVVNNELYKLLKQKKLYVFMGVIVAWIIFQYISTRYNFSFDNFKVVNGQSFPLKILTGMFTILLLYMTLILSEMVTDEYKTGTVKLVLIHPVTRIRFLLSKIVALFVGLLILQIFTLIMSYLFGLIFFDWGTDFLFTGNRLALSGEFISVAQLYSGVSGILFNFYAYILTILPLMGIGTSMLFISLLFSNTGLTNAISLGFWMVIEPFLSNIKSLRPFLLGSYFYFISLFIQKIDLKVVTTGILVILAYAVIFFLAGVLYFRKKDILN